MVSVLQVDADLARPDLCRASLTTRCLLPILMPGFLFAWQTRCRKSASEQRIGAEISSPGGSVLFKKSIVLTLLCLSRAWATPIIAATSGIGSQIVTFDELGSLTVDQPINNQFSAFGVSVSSPSGVFANSQGGSGLFDGSNGFNGNYIGNFQWNSSSIIDAPDPNFVTFQFASTVSAATLAVLSNLGASATFSSFSGATLVETFTIPLVSGAGNFYGFQNSAFDRIVIRQDQGTAQNNDAVYDNVSFSPLATGAPELSLPGAGLALCWLAGLCLTFSSRSLKTCVSTSSSIV
jgi:hypothetical protein